MLIKVKWLGNDLDFTDAPPLVEALINTDDVVSAVAAEPRGDTPFVRVKFRDGSTATVQGTLDDLLKK